MATFFVSALTETVIIIGEDAKHIALSLRLSCGDTLPLCDGKGRMAIGTITACHPTEVVFSCTAPTAAISEPKSQITLYQAMPKGDKPEIIIQKAVELGIHEIIFFLSTRCISRPTQKDFAKKLARFEKIALEAAKQSGRGVIPIIRGILEIDMVLAQLSSFDCAVLFYEKSVQPLHTLLPQDLGSIAIIIGSEGGFSPEEVEKFKNSDVSIASLGTRILRCETASLAATSAILYHLGEF